MSKPGFEFDVCSEDSSEFYDEIIKLPKELRGYVRYIVILHPGDRKPYSVGVKYVCNTEGAQNLMAYLLRNVNRKHKKHVHSWLCQSVVDGSQCALDGQCPNIHVTSEGYLGRRNWLRPLKGSRLLVSDDESQQDDIEVISVQTDTTTDSMGPSAATSSPTPSLDSLASLCGSPHAFRPISPTSSSNSTSPIDHQGSLMEQQPLFSQTPRMRRLNDPYCPYMGQEKQLHARVEHFVGGCDTHVRPKAKPWQSEELWSKQSPQYNYMEMEAPFSCGVAASLKPHYTNLSKHAGGDQCNQFGAAMRMSQAHAPYSPHLCSPTSQGISDVKLHQGHFIVEPQPHDARVRLERLEKTRAKLHNAVDWILSNDKAKGADLSSINLENIRFTASSPLSAIHANVPWHQRC